MKGTKSGVGAHLNHRPDMRSTPEKDKDNEILQKLTNIEVLLTKLVDVLGGDNQTKEKKTLLKD
tara:strand:- start:987 stop:1178 length:192 start_codon:yes stop_codon:yes gene_type:complete